MSEIQNLIDPTILATLKTLTVADAILVDPKSEAFIPARCVDCGTQVLIDPQVPEGVDPNIPRVPLCRPHGNIRAGYAARQAQKVEERRKRYDLGNMSAAEAGAIVQQQLRAVAVEQVKAAVPVVENMRAEHEAGQVAAIATEQEARKERVLPGFMVGTTLEVPELDASDTCIASLDEEVNSKMRSPYNKARYRLGVEGGPLDKHTTYRALLVEHERLREMATEANNKARKEAKTAKKAKKEEPAKPKTKKAKKQTPVQTPAPKVIVADLDADKAFKRKRNALAKLLNISRDDAAKKILAIQ